MQINTLGPLIHPPKDLRPERMPKPKNLPPTSSRILFIIWSFAGHESTLHPQHLCSKKRWLQSHQLAGFIECVIQISITSANYALLERDLVAINTSAITLHGNSKETSISTKGLVQQQSSKDEKKRKPLIESRQSTKHEQFMLWLCFFLKCALYGVQHHVSSSNVYVKTLLIGSDSFVIIWSPLIICT